MNSDNANTYCMKRVNGRLCHARIPLGETVCADCKRGHSQACPIPSREVVQ